MFDSEPLAFATDPHILRGRYEGVIDTRIASTALALTTDGTTLAMGVGDGRAVVQLWDTRTQTPLKSLGQLDEATSFVNDVAITADGSRVASTSGGKAQVWDVTTGKVVREIATGDPFYAAPLDLSSDGTHLAVGKYGEPQLFLYEVATGEELRVFTAPGEALDDFSFSTDGTFMAAIFSQAKTAANETRTFYLRVWQVETGTELLAVEGSRPSYGYPFLAFSADGLSVAFATGQTVSVRDVATGQATLTLASPNQATHLALSPDGSRLAVGSFQSEEVASIKFFEVASGTEQHDIEDVSWVEWSRDGRFLIADVLRGTRKDVGGLQAPFWAPTLLRADDFLEVGSFVNGKFHQVVLEATPEYVDDQHYRVTGTVRLDGEAAIPFEGTVAGNESQRYLSSQARLPNPAEFSLTLQDHPWKLHGHQQWEQSQTDWQQARDWTGFIEDTAYPDSPFISSFLELRRVGEMP